MRVAVMSPHTQNNGNTTLAMLIAMKLASTGKSTCIGHIKPISNSFYKYLNFSMYQDKTSTPSQIVKLIKEGGLSDDDVHDYCKKVSDDLEAFTNNATNFDIDDMSFMTEYMAKSFPHENVVFDIDDDNDDNVENIVKLCDIVVLNLTQSVVELTDFKNNKDRYLKLMGEKPVITVVNRYNSIKSTIGQSANMMGIKKPNKWVVLHDNPWINWATNAGNLQSLFRCIQKKDIRVIEINKELDKILKLMYKAYNSKGRAKNINKEGR